MSNVFYKYVSKKHLERLEDELDYYIACAVASDSKENKKAYELMADFYNELVVTAKNHIAKHQD